MSLVRASHQYLSGAEAALARHAHDRVPRGKVENRGVEEESLERRGSDEIRLLKVDERRRTSDRSALGLPL